MSKSQKFLDELPDLVRTLGETLFALRGAGKDPQSASLAHEALAVSGLGTALEELRAAYFELVESREIAEMERARYQDLFQFAPDAYLVTNISGRIFEANVAAARLFQVAMPFLVEKPLVVYVHREDLPLLSETLRRLRTSDRTECALRVVPRSEEKTLLHIHATIGAENTGTGTQTRSLRWIIHDVTKRVEAEREIAARGNQLRELTAELARVEDRERRRIAAAIHDNLSQNLAIARMKVSALRQDGGLAGLKADALKDVDEILGAAVAESRNLTFDLSPPVLYELGLIAGLEWLGERIQRQYGLNIKVTGVVRDAPPVDETRVMLFQAVRELLTNAVKHAHAKTARVTVTCPNGEWRITVVDNGIGMNPAETHSASKKEKKNGQTGAAESTGFGLFNIRTRLELMGGGMSIAQAPRKGTQVSLFVPSHSKDAAPSESSPQSHSHLENGQ